MARKLSTLIKKIETLLAADLSDFRSGLEPAERAERVLGFVVSSDFERRDHKKRQAMLDRILVPALTTEEARLMGPIITLTPAEANIDGSIAA